MINPEKRKLNMTVTLVYFSPAYLKWPVAHLTLPPPFGIQYEKGTVTCTIASMYAAFFNGGGEGGALRWPKILFSLCTGWFKKIQNKALLTSTSLDKGSFSLTETHTLWETVASFEIEILLVFCNKMTIYLFQLCLESWAKERTFIKTKKATGRVLLITKCLTILCSRYV